MRSSGRDIVELFGFSPDDVSEPALAAWNKKWCPFVEGSCSKTNHDQSLVYGTCSVSAGIKNDQGSEIIICPKRLYAKNYEIFKFVLESAWPNQNKKLLIGGTIDELKKRSLEVENPVIAFGQGSGREIQIKSNGSLNMDWVFQSYEKIDGKLIAKDFVGLEVQSIDITGNYRDNWAAYKKLKDGKIIDTIPNSGHGLNWANVHKRLIPQIIRKGNIYSKIDRCIGFYFIVPDSVYKKFEEVIGSLEEQPKPKRDNLSVITFSLGDILPHGSSRPLKLIREVNYSLSDVAMSFVASAAEEAPTQLDSHLSGILN